MFYSFEILRYFVHDWVKVFHVRSKRRYVSNSKFPRQDRYHARRVEAEFSPREFSLFSAQGGGRLWTSRWRAWKFCVYSTHCPGPGNGILLKSPPDDEGGPFSSLGPSARDSRGARTQRLRYTPVPRSRDFAPRYFRKPIFIPTRALPGLNYRHS